MNPESGCQTQIDSKSVVPLQTKKRSYRFRRFPVHGHQTKIMAVVTDEVEMKSLPSTKGNDVLSNESVQLNDIQSPMEDEKGSEKPVSVPEVVVESEPDGTMTDIAVTESLLLHSSSPST